MKNRFLLTTCLVVSSFLAFTTAQAKELKLAYDADPVTLDIHEQLSGGVLQLSHMSFDPLIRWSKDDIRAFMREHKLPFHPRAVRPKPAPPSAKQPLPPSYNY